jgi:hypothetical protein
MFLYNKMSAANMKKKIAILRYLNTATVLSLLPFNCIHLYFILQQRYYPNCIKNSITTLTIPYFSNPFINHIKPLA